MLNNEKVDILGYLHNNPNSTSNQINNLIIRKGKSKKTTSTIYRYVHELVSGGYLIESGTIHKGYSITRKGRELLDSLSKRQYWDQERNIIIQVFVFSSNGNYIDYYSFCKNSWTRCICGGRFS